MTTTLPTKACHNCRRRRHRCDRSIPTCRKCAVKGEECLGYGQLLRWTGAVATPRKLAGKAGVTAVTSELARRSAPDLPMASICGYNPLDPLLQDLSPQSRLYIHYFNSVVCRDLIAFDNNLGNNPFRYMIPLTKKYEYLREIVIATSAIHITAFLRVHGPLHRRELVDALSAKQRAIQLLRVAMTRVDVSSRPVLLAAVVFLLNFDLIDTGRGEWKTHMDAAGTLITSINDADSHFDLSLASLCNNIVADCLTYHILGLTINTVDGNMVSVYGKLEVATILRKTEAANYHCCPPELLEIILSMSQLCRDAHSSGGLMTYRHIKHAACLMEQAVSFDIRSWVQNIQNLSPFDDLEARINIGSAYRAAVRLYILLAAPEASEICGSITVEELAADILRHLSSVPVEHVLLKGTVWPTFLAASQMDDKKTRKWFLGQLRAICFTNPMTCPWGYIQTAMQILESIWETRDREPDGGKSMNWLQLLQRLPANCLIV